MRHVQLAALFLALCVGGTPASAAVQLWGLDEDANWANPNNWTPDGTIIGPVPGPADHAIIFQSVISPTVTTVEEVSIFTPSWFDGHDSTVNIGAGGSLNATNFARLSAGDSAVSTVNFLPGAGDSIWNVLQMSFNNADNGFPIVGEGVAADSFINLDGGVLHLGSLSFVNNGENTTNIDLGGDGLLLVNGDQTDAGSGLSTIWTDADWLTADDGTGTVDVFYNVDNSWTEFRVQTSGPLPGDANNDGTVDLLDLDILGTNFGATPATFAQGDFNGDNVVDLLDLDILGTNFGSSAASAVPEPASLALLGLAGFCCLIGRQRTA